MTCSKREVPPRPRFQACTLEAVFCGHSLFLFFVAQGLGIEYRLQGGGHIGGQFAREEEGKGLVIVELEARARGQAFVNVASGGERGQSDPSRNPLLFLLGSPLRPKLSKMGW